MELDDLHSAFEVLKEMEDKEYRTTITVLKDFVAKCEKQGLADYAYHLKNQLEINYTASVQSQWFSTVLFFAKYPVLTVIDSFTSNCKMQIFVDEMRFIIAFNVLDLCLNLSHVRFWNVVCFADNSTSTCDAFVSSSASEYVGLGLGPNGMVQTGNTLSITSTLLTYIL